MGKNEKLRIVQFLIATILHILMLSGAIIWFFVFIPILLTLLLGFITSRWNYFWNMIILEIIITIIAFVADWAFFKVALIFERFFNEEEENENIYQKYEEWYEEWYQKEYEKYERARQEQQQGNRNYYSTENLIKKFEEYLEVLSLSSGGELTLQIIKKAHRTKSKEFHPDKNLGKDTTSEMQLINEAKEYLDANLEYYLSQKFRN